MNSGTRLISCFQDVTINTRRHVLSRVRNELKIWEMVVVVAMFAMMIISLSVVEATATVYSVKDDMIGEAQHEIMGSQLDPGSTLTIDGILAVNIADISDPDATLSMSNNTINVDIALTSPDYTIVAGVTDMGDISGNVLNIVGNNVGGSAGGGMSRAATATVSGNRVFLQDAAVGGGMSGGSIIGRGEVSSNEVHLTATNSAVSVGFTIYGGIAGEGGTIKNNKVYISEDYGITVGGAIVAGSTDGTNLNSELSGNEIHVDAGAGSVTVGDHVVGAWVSGAASSVQHSLSSNKVILYRGTYNNFVAGAFGSDGSDAVTNSSFTSNGVEIRGDVGIAEEVYGAKTSGSDPNSNTFEENYVKITDEGSADPFLTVNIAKGVYGAVGNSGTAENNKVIISTRGNVVVGHGVYGARLEHGLSLSGNEVDISTVGTGTVDIGWNVAGGFSGSTDLDTKVVDNKVKLRGSITLDEDLFGGYAANGNADGNTVDFDGLDPLKAAIADNAYGGYVATGTSNHGASNNSIRLGNVKLTGGAPTTIAAGWVNSGTGAKAENNSLELFGKIDLGTGIDLAVGGGTGVSFTNGFKGNTLSLSHITYTSVNKSFKDVYGFDKLIFNVNATEITAANTAATALLLANTVRLTDGTDNASILVNVTDGSSATGKEIYLISTGSSSGITTNGPIQTGLAVDGLLERVLELEFQNTSETIKGTMGAGKPRDEAKALSELPLADISFVNRGSDFIASRAIPAALASVSGAVGVAAFATLGYGWERTETGSHVDVKGFSGDIGLAVGTDTSVGPFVAGAFLEFGDGTYDSYNQFSGIANSVHGEGDLSYIGGGVFARLDFGQPDTSRPYFEASVRFGKTDADFRTSDFTATLGTEVNYDFDAKYWGFHAGGGYIINFAGFDGSLDLSAKYFHTHRDGDDFIAFNQRVELSSVTSSRMRVGGRLNAGLTPTIKGYFGLYFEHEFDGDSNVSYAGYALPEASLGGSSGVGELGLIVSSPSSPLEVQLGVEGSAGRRDAISANLGLRFTF
jgi:hypothetical protein